MKPFPTSATLPENCTYGKPGSPCICVFCERDLARARADWYASEVVPLLRDLLAAWRDEGPTFDMSRVEAALKACEEDKP